MSGKAQEPSQGMSLENKTSRRTLLKRALVVLGAGAVMQVSGGVLGLHAATHKSEIGKTEAKANKGNKSHKENKTTHKMNKATHKMNEMDKRIDKMGTTQAPVKGTGQPQ